MSKPTLAQSNRERFLRRVRAFWIEGVLDHSLHGAALIALGLQEQRDALANPWHLLFHHPDTAPRPFPVGTAIIQVYDAANGQLLILGAPGAGKTTLLLELARNLLNRAQQDEQHPMPVVFTLSSWAAGQQPLGEWVIEELISKYQVPRQLARTWVETDQLPLLDGLDEVAVEHRTRCIEAINTYQQEHAFLPLVVASRSADYLAQAARVQLTSAVTIQPLTQQQVEEYLLQAGEQLAALRVALHQDAALRELTETPLMLSILTLTYHSMPVEELLRGGVAPTRQQVFERYVKQALTRRGGKTQYKPEQTMKWLTWLAQQMRQHNQTMFFIEQMQPDWLPRGNQSDWFSLQRITRCIYRIIIGLLSGGVIGILLGLISGLLSGLVSAVLSGTLFENSHSSVFGNLVLPFVWTLVLVNEIFSVLIAVVIVGIVGGLASALKKEIHPVEVVTWSWKGIQQWRYWLIGMLVGGLIFGLLSAQSIGMVQANEPDTHMYSLPLISKLIIGLSGGLLGGLVGGLLGGVSRTTLDVHTRVRPNQGVWRSLQYSTLFGGLSGAVVILISVPLEAWILGQLVLQQYSDTGHSLNSPYLAVSDIFVLISGLLIALSLGLIYGGVACLQHLNLRLLLWFTKRIPRNYPRFLDYAAEHILLRKVGGGYIFVHRLLLEYFASLDTTATPDGAGAKRE